MLRISLVIPTLDRAHTLPRALDSVLAQTRPADEIIVIDDGSTDDTAELVHKRYPSVRYIRQPNRGVSAARNAGIRIASGDWIALLDSDDAWHPRKLERQLDTLLPDARIAHCDEIWIRSGVRVNPMRKHAKAGGRIYRHCLPLCAISPSAVLIHREVFERVGLFDESLQACEDYDLWLRITAHWPVRYLDEPLVIKHGGHTDQLSRRHPAMDRFRVRALEKMLAEDVLSEADRRATLATLVDKLDILEQGARKRGLPEAGDYATRRARYCTALERCT
jgi:glycosyltransferase involved in cell wall biosynthesis